jgi:DUF4097 and DUF4098 domain-containing protein YvlB
MSRHGCAAVIAVLAAAGSGCVINLDADHVIVREEKEFKVGPGAEVSLDTFDGSIQVESWDRDVVHIEIQKRGPDRETAAALEVRAAQEGNRIKVEAPAPKVRHEVIGINASSPSASLVVRVPAKAKLTANTRDGSIAVDRITGVVNLRSGDGSIRANSINGELTANTEDGALSLVNVNGRLSLQSGDGSINVQGRFDHLDARTGDGSITIEAENGSAMKDNWQIETGDGSVSFVVPGQFSAEIDASSRDGRVRSDIEGLQANNDDDDRGTLRGRIGSGGHTVTIRSGDGSITVLSR